jgi:hypothetical protein
LELLEDGGNQLFQRNRHAVVLLETATCNWSVVCCSEWAYRRRLRDSNGKNMEQH